MIPSQIRFRFFFATKLDAVFPSNFKFTSSKKKTKMYLIFFRVKRG